MGYSAVDDKDLFHPAPDGFGAALDLGYHAAGNDSASHQRRNVAYVDNTNQRVLVLLVTQNPRISVMKLSFPH
jgi:hypothetical protein